MYYANELEISVSWKDIFFVLQLIPSHKNPLYKQFVYNYYVNIGVLKYTYSLVTGINRQMIYTRQQNDMCDLFPKITIKHTGKIVLSLTTPMGAQWLSGRMFDSRPRGHGFEHHRLHCIVSFSKTH